MVVNDGSGDLLWVVTHVTAWRCWNVERLDTLLKRRANTAAHLLLIKILLRRIHVLVMSLHAKPTCAVLDTSAA